MNFADFQQNNRVFLQKCALKTYQLWGEVMFRQLVLNLAIFGRIDSIFMQKNCVFEKYHLQGEFIFPQLISGKK